MGPVRLNLARVVILSVSLIAAADARASVIFTTFGPADSFNTGSSWIIGLDDPEFQVAMNFVAGFDGNLTSIRVPTQHISGSDNDYNVFFAADNAGVPGAALESFTGLAFNTGSAAIQTLTSSLNPVLTTGSTYWIVMTAADPANAFGGWYANDQGINGLYRNTGSGWFEDSNASPAVEVNAAEAVPEPGTILLTLGGLTALIVRKFRRPRSA